MDALKTFALILLLILVIIFAPIFTIMALNTLFGLGIAITFWTWLSAVWLQMVTFGGVAASLKK